LSPQEEYGKRLAARSAAYARSARTEARISYGRLAAVAGTAACVWLAVNDLLPVWLILAPVATFVALAVWHDRVFRQSDRLARSIIFYQDGVARIEDKWHGIGEQGLRFLDEDHLYARDLDLFGNGSIFQLLSRARTHAGEEMLARWLKSPTGLPEVRRRQAAIAELREKPDFREALATAGGGSRDINTTALSAWASSPSRMPGTSLRVAAVVLAFGIFSTGIWWALGGPLSPLLFVILVKMILTRPSRKTVDRVVEGVEAPLGQLDVLTNTLALIEEQSPLSPRLVELGTSLVSDGVLPSEAIQRLKHLTDMLDWRRNVIFAPISAALSWPLHLAAAIEAWRRTFGPNVLAWVSTIAEYEALSSLAAYSYEHPADPFPMFLDDAPARLEATSLGHPLVPAARMVRNDLALTPDVRLLIVSGSNMSGKSTLLRTVGVNVVLAMAGAPVRAERLALTPLAVGASLHIDDSLQAGRSRFFAEISRIRAITDLAAQQPPLFFLLDELFQGTNSHDRKIGADALLGSLVDRGAIGLTTTHDLALALIADQSGGRIVNVHFEDRLRDGQLVFDYRMRPGPVTHSNALALMRAVGLPVS
jgi:NAD(P)-dependent dehydrogenase (short-subunit alcohol dehydrogenase family)